MNRRQIALKLVLEELDVPATMDSFDGRLIVQKAVYMAQQAGIPLGYHYYWYLRGPYSRELTGDAYETLGDTPEGWNLDEPTKKKLAPLKKFFKELNAEGDPVKNFELHASVLFTLATGQARENESHRITKLMHDAGKTSFSQEDVNGAIERLRGQNLLPSV